LKEDSLHALIYVAKLIPAGDNFVVFDYNFRRIYLYDSTGNFIITIGQFGEGPNEYTNVSDVFYK